MKGLESKYYNSSTNKYIYKDCAHCIFYKPNHVYKGQGLCEKTNSGTRDHRICDQFKKIKPKKKVIVKPEIIFPDELS